MKFFKVDESRFTHDYIQMLQIIMLNSLGFFFIGFWIPIIARENMGASAFQISIVVVSWVVGRMVSGFVTGFISDHVKSRTSLVLTGSFGRGISYFIIYTAFIANHIYILMIGHAALGLCAGIFWVPFNMFVAEKTSKNHRAYAYGRRDATNAIGQIIGGVFGFIYLMILSTFTSNPFILYIPIPVYGISNFIAGIIFYRKVDESIKFSDENENNSDI
ncbi:MAG: MFS transporter, partial [Promethearchaeota archaeon]